jgi:hypothetical protein
MILEEPSVSRIPDNVRRRIERDGSIGAWTETTPNTWEIDYEFPECETCGAPLDPNTVERPILCDRCYGDAYRTRTFWLGLRAEH